MKHRPQHTQNEIVIQNNQSWFLPLCVWQFGSPCSQFLSICTSASKSGKLKDSRPASHTGVDQRATAAARIGTRLCKTKLSAPAAGVQLQESTRHIPTPEPLLTLIPASPTQGLVNFDMT